MTQDLFNWFSSWNFLLFLTSSSSVGLLIIWWTQFHHNLQNTLFKFYCLKWIETLWHRKVIQHVINNIKFVHKLLLKLQTTAGVTFEDILLKFFLIKTSNCFFFFTMFMCVCVGSISITMNNAFGKYLPKLPN